MAMHRSRKQGAALAAVLWAIGGVLTGCASAPARSAVAFPHDTNPPLLSLTLPPVPTYSGYAPPLNAVTTTVDWPYPVPPMRYPMDWLPFTVTLTNESGTAFHELEPVIVMGQCTCNPGKYYLRPYDVLQIWDPQQGGWRNINSAIQKSDGTYTSAQQAAPIDLPAHRTASVRYRIQLANPAKQAGLVDGDGSLNVYVLQLPGHERVITGLGPDVTEPLRYEFAGGLPPGSHASSDSPPFPSSRSSPSFPSATPTSGS